MMYRVKNSTCDDIAIAYGEGAAQRHSSQKKSRPCAQKRKGKGIVRHKVECEDSEKRP